MNISRIIFDSCTITCSNRGSPRRPSQCSHEIDTYTRGNYKITRHRVTFKFVVLSKHYSLLSRGFNIQYSIFITGFTFLFSRLVSNSTISKAQDPRNVKTINDALCFWNFHLAQNFVHTIQTSRLERLL